MDSQWTNYHAESGACLLMALRQNRRGVNTDIDSLLSAQEIGTVTIYNRSDLDPSTQGLVGVPLPTIVDAWGHPLAYFRCPTGNPELNSTSSSDPQWIYSSPTRDPQDPEGTLCDSNWVYSPGWKSFCELDPLSGMRLMDNNGHLIDPLGHLLPWQQPSGGKFGSFKVTPLVASFGAAYGLQRKTAGLHDQFMTLESSGSDNGNIYSYRLRLVQGVIEHENHQYKVW